MISVRGVRRISCGHGPGLARPVSQRCNRQINGCIMQTEAKVVRRSRRSDGPGCRDPWVARQPGRRPERLRYRGGPPPFAADHHVETIEVDEPTPRPGRVRRRPRRRRGCRRPAEDGRRGSHGDRQAGARTGTAGEASRRFATRGLVGAPEGRSAESVEERRGASRSVRDAMPSLSVGLCNGWSVPAIVRAL